MSRYFARLAERTGLVPSPVRPAVGATPVPDIAVKEIVSAEPARSTVPAPPAAEAPPSTPGRQRAVDLITPVADKTSAPRATTAESASAPPPKPAASLAQRVPQKSARTLGKTKLEPSALKTKTLPAASEQMEQRITALRENAHAAPANPAPRTVNSEVFAVTLTPTRAATFFAPALEQKSKLHSEPVVFETEIIEGKSLKPMWHEPAAPLRPMSPRASVVEQRVSSPSFKSPPPHANERAQVEVKIGTIALQIHQAPPRAAPEPLPAAPPRERSGFRPSRHYWRGW